MKTQANKVFKQFWNRFGNYKFTTMTKVASGAGSVAKSCCPATCSPSRSTNSNGWGNQKSITSAFRPRSGINQTRCRQSQHANNPNQNNNACLDRGYRPAFGHLVFPEILTCFVCLFLAYLGQPVMKIEVFELSIVNLQHLLLVVQTSDGRH